jgi:hypothetical protein
MNLKEVKLLVEDMGLSDEATQKVDAILAPFTENDEIGDEIVDQIMVIMDSEIDVNDLVEDIDEDIVADIDKTANKSG